MNRKTALRISVATCVLLTAVMAAQPLAGEGWGTPVDTQAVPAAVANDNRVAAGSLRDGVLHVRLELRQVTWYPENEGGPSLKVFAFAEEGKPAQVPGPLLRVPAGTEIRATVHNALQREMWLHGFHHHPGEDNAVRLPAGASQEMRFQASEPGTYYYTARSIADSIAQFSNVTVVSLPKDLKPVQEEAELSGAIVVDAPGAAVDDRVFVIGLLVKSLEPEFREVLTINGKSWPFTERLRYQQGDTVRWRVVNTSVSDHSLHLHGFYFRLTNVGDGARDQRLPGDGRLEVTEHIPQGGTIALTWNPERVGNWIFHCHMVAHMVDAASLAPEPKGGGVAQEHSHDSERMGMGGLVLGITVLPAKNAAASAASVTAPRQLRLLIRERAPEKYAIGGYSFRIEDPGKPAADKKPERLPYPGAPLVLTRGQPVEITVENQLKQSTVVHWHGIELESYDDGVAYWGGHSPQMTPPIAPGQSFVARMTPPRAGTFIYHTHWHDVAQLTGGLYGPLIVLEPGQNYDPETDKVFLLGRGGPDENVNPLVLNGSPQPFPLVLKAGTRYRLRLINMTPNDADAVVSLLAGNEPVQWRPLAKDGADLPPDTRAVAARQPITVGETYDFEYTPQRTGTLALEVYAPFTQSKLTQMIEVH